MKKQQHQIAPLFQYISYGFKCLCCFLSVSLLFIAEGKVLKHYQINVSQEVFVSVCMCEGPLTLQTFNYWCAEQTHYMPLSSIVMP